MKKRMLALILAAGLLAFALSGCAAGGMSSSSGVSSGSSYSGPATYSGTTYGGSGQVTKLSE